MLASVCKGHAFQVMYQHDREPSLLSFQPQLTVFGKQELSGEVRPCALQKKMLLYQTFCQCYVTGNYKRLYPSFKLLTRPKVIGKCNAAKTVALMEWVTFFFFSLPFFLDSSYFIRRSACAFQFWRNFLLFSRARFHGEKRSDPVWECAFWFSWNS